MALANHKFQKLMDDAAEAALKHRAALNALSVAVIERYGTHYSDVDCDAAIDSFDYGGESLTVDEMDKAMAMCGVNKI